MNATETLWYTVMKAGGNENSSRNNISSGIILSDSHLTQPGSDFGGLIGDVSAEKVRACILDGADVMYIPSGCRSEGTVLSALACSAHANAFLECLKTPLNVDFNIISHYMPRNTIMHCIVDNKEISIQQMSEMLCAVVRHIQLHPQDTADWGIKISCGKAFIDVAAENGVLHVVYPIVRSMPFYEDRTSPLRLICAWRYDYERLSPEDQQDFDISETRIYEASEPTALLCRLSRSRAPAAGDVQALIAAGAEVMYIGAGSDDFSLSEFLWRKNISCVLTSLSSSRWVDFTLTSSTANKWTFLHSLAWRVPPSPIPHPTATYVRILHAVIDHTDAHTSDRIDWGMRDADGHECISNSAATGWLSEWWGVVNARRVEYYVHHEGPIAITHRVMRRDWQKVPEEFKDRFLLLAGLANGAE